MMSARATDGHEHDCGGENVCEEGPLDSWYIESELVGDEGQGDVYAGLVYHGEVGAYGNGGVYPPLVITAFDYGSTGPGRVSEGMPGAG